MAIFSIENEYDLSNIDLKRFLKIIIKDNIYKKDNLISYLIFDFFELYFSKTNKNFFLDFNNKYSYFVKRMSDMKRFNLDKESLFIEFEETMLNG